MGGLSELLQQLREAGTVCLDTVIFIYAFERHPRFGPAAQAIFRAVAAGEFEAYASVLVAGEVLTGVKKAGDDELLLRYRDLFQRFPGLTMVDANLAVMEQMAALRAAFGLPTPDAIHLATTLVQKAPVFLTNDLRLERVDVLQVLNLQTFV
jgi:predicted nucleic acid-binding protein